MLIFSGLIYLIVKDSSLEIGSSYLIVNQIITIFKVPLGVLASLVTILMLLAVAHRSEQTKEQIRESRTTNRLSNYFKHIEEFEKFMLKVSNAYEDVDFQGVRRLHKILFPDAKSGDFSICPKLIEKIRYLIFYLAKTEQTDCSFKGIYSPEIDVMSSMNHGLGHDIKTVNFAPRAEVFITGLYGVFEIVDQEYVGKVVHSLENENTREDIIDCYDRLSAIVSTLFQFSMEEDSNLIPETKNDIFNLDLKNYKSNKEFIKLNVKVTFFPLGMVHKVIFLD